MHRTAAITPGDSTSLKIVKEGEGESSIIVTIDKVLHRAQAEGAPKWIQKKKKKSKKLEIRHL